MYALAVFKQWHTYTLHTIGQTYSYRMV